MFMNTTQQLVIAMHNARAQRIQAAEIEQACQARLVEQLGHDTLLARHPVTGTLIQATPKYSKDRETPLKGTAASFGMSVQRFTALSSRALDLSKIKAARDAGRLPMGFTDLVKVTPVTPSIVLTEK